MCITDNDGLIIEEMKYYNTLSKAHDFAQNIDQQYDSSNCIAVVETTASMWIRIYKPLGENNMYTKLANPFKTRV